MSADAVLGALDLNTPGPAVEIRRLNTSGAVVQVKLAGRTFAVCASRKGTGRDVEIFVNEFLEGGGVKRHVTETLLCP